MGDSMRMGYLIPLWADVLVDRDPLTQEKTFNWRVTENVFEPHGDESWMVEKFDGYDSPVMKFNNMWTAKTPPGYSCIVTSPVGYKNLPFKTITAVIDTDRTNLAIPNPGYFKSGFEGIIPKGTPLIQIIPFKRDDWSSSFSFLEEDRYRQLEDKEFNSTLINHYARFVKAKKEFL
jgi:hypothetical protein